MIEIKNVSKRFAQKKPKRNQPVEAISSGTASSRDKKWIQVLDNVSLIAKPGSIYGLLGPNGAGKTTTLRCIATLLKPDAGEISINGLNVQTHPKAVRAQIGLLTSDMRLSGNLSSRELMQFFGKLNHMESGHIEYRIVTLASYLGMSEFIDRPIIQCSTGQKQKASIAVALIHNPDVIIFDEPTNGLDILTARTVIDFLQDFKNQGKTVILSTHIMSEAETLCDTIGIMLNGRVACQGTLNDLLASQQTDSLSDAFFKVAQQYGGVAGD
jgi:sodium transport system ATP-binding protein